jgi:AcrR family transcriptional regulator
MGEDPTSVAVTADGARPRLDRERILDAAQAIAATEGVGKLTMRRIGTELGADPTAVYRHFRSKDEMLVQLADRLFGIGPELDPTASWRDQLRAELRFALSRYRAHPDLAMLLAVQPDDTPSLQHIADRTLGLLMDRGLSTKDAGMFFQLIENHVVGTGLYYAMVEHAEDPRLRDPEAMRRLYALLPADAFPNAVKASPDLFPDLDETFDLGTDCILDAIERRTQPHPSGSTTTGASS